MNTQRLIRAVERSFNPPGENYLNFCAVECNYVVKKESYVVFPGTREFSWLK